MNSEVFWSTLLGAAFGASVAFSLAYVRDHFNNINQQKSALKLAQMTLAYQSDYLDAFLHQIIGEAKVAAATEEKPEWYGFARRVSGRPPILIDRESLSFLLDRRFQKAAGGFENLYVEIFDATKKFEQALDLIVRFNLAKEKFEANSLMLVEKPEDLDPSKLQEVAFERSDLPLVMEIKSCLNTLEEISESTSSDLLKAFHCIDQLFLSRWRETGGVQLVPVEKPIESPGPRAVYGDRYR